MFWYCFREREKILDLFEMSSGQRMHTRYIQVGGVMEDIPPRLRGQAARRSCADMPTRADQYADLLEKNEIVLERLRGTGDRRPGDAARARRHRPAAARHRQSRGTCARPHPYSSYDHFEFKIPVGTVGDNYDRYRVRHAEIYESVKIIEQALDGLPEGPYITPDRKVALPPRHELATEHGGADPPLQARHRGLPRPAGRGATTRSRARAASSAASSAPTARPSRPASTCATRASSTSRRSRHMVRDGYIADLIATLAMLDPILGGIDR